MYQLYIEWSMSLFLSCLNTIRFFSLFSLNFVINLNQSTRLLRDVIYWNINVKIILHGSYEEHMGQSIQEWIK